MCDLVLFVERTGELRLCSKVKNWEVWSRSESESEEGDIVTRGRPETG
jgi:hypothetical protein